MVNGLIYLATLILLVTAVIFGYILAQLFQGLLALSLEIATALLILVVTLVILMHILLQLIGRKQLQLLATAAQLPSQSPPLPPVQHNGHPQDQTPPLPEETPHQPDENSPHSELENQLIAMLDGNRAWAERLVQEDKQKYPGHPEDWYLERLIEELEHELGTPDHTDQRLPNNQVQDRLITMVGGDRARAERLVHQVRLDYPGQTENWYWERAISDLERG